MGLQDRSYTRNYLGTPGFPPGVKWLLIIQGAIFVFLFVGSAFGLSLVDDFRVLLALTPKAVVEFLWVWQLLTYSFLHYDAMHFLFNALTIWFMGSALEGVWRTRRFLQFYMLCALGGGIMGVIGGYVLGGVSTPTIGASGAGFGLLVAFGVLFAEQTIIFIIFLSSAGGASCTLFCNERK